VVVRGAVQGVGFRPFIYTLARSHGLTGWVTNTPNGVIIEAEGHPADVRFFVTRLESDKPSPAIVQSLESSFLDPVGYTDFSIVESLAEGPPTTVIMPDMATCGECIDELRDPANRRYRYPFINCTHCGPRYSIILDIPYDRPNTTMRDFAMCPSCCAEYENPLDRRFHAQPIACPVCGPQLALWDRSGKVIAARDTALLMAAKRIMAGEIVAVKGLGGFQLMVDATSEEAVQRLRARKKRDEKPFAVMYPSIEVAERDCILDDLEQRLLRSAQSPIVLARKQLACSLAPSVAPGNPDVGVMVPYSPVHHLLLDAVGIPVVATSGNLSEEPICIDNQEALTLLSDIADVFLVHDRPIARHVDDSVVRIVADREMVIRRARGYAPLPLDLCESTAPILAVGAHQKSTLAFAVNKQTVVSQHIGDLDSLSTWNVFNRVLDDLSRMYEFEPAAVACDLHPDYSSTKYAAATGKRVIAIQHHHAHALACMVDNHLSGDVLAATWDGTGYGTDGTIWGGEFLGVHDSGFERIASLLTFRLPGGEAAVHEPRRTALGLLYEFIGEEAFDRTDLAPVGSFSQLELKNVKVMLRRGINTPVTSSMGRLFDGVAAILGVRQIVRHEGQAAAELEYLARQCECDAAYAMPVVCVRGRMAVDWRPMLATIIQEQTRGVSVELIARRFHNALAGSIVTIAELAGIERVVLTGGCFQNRLLTERSIQRLRADGFAPYWHQRIPPNDGGISVGQLAGAAAVLAASSRELRANVSAAISVGDLLCV